MTTPSYLYPDNIFLALLIEEEGIQPAYAERIHDAMRMIWTHSKQEVKEKHGGIVLRDVMDRINDHFTPVQRPPMPRNNRIDHICPVCGHITHGSSPARKRCDLCIREAYNTRIRVQMRERRGYKERKAK